MKNIKYLSTLLAILIFHNCYSQNEANIWYFGSHAGLDFNSGSPVALTDGAMDQFEGCASMADSDGDLLFYSDGSVIWNKNHDIMDNGSGLLGDPSSTQSCIFVPKPGAPTLYYIFTVPQRNESNGDLYYSVVDITLDGGLGSVITKNVFLHSNVTERITAVNHSNGTDIWVVTHERENDIFCSFLVTSAGVTPTPIISSTGTVHNSGIYGLNYVGYLKASPSGDFMACAINGDLEKFELFDFDNTTGILTNPIAFDGYNRAYGIEFSPLETRLYLGSSPPGKVYQIDLTAGTPTDIVNSSILVGTITGSGYIGAIQIGVDAKVYVSVDNSDHLGVINYPDVLGVGCDFVEEGVSLSGRTAEWGLPTFIQSYFSANITYQNECFGDTTFFTVSSSMSIQSITWDFGDPTSGSNNTSTDLDPWHIFTSPGLYTVTATMILTDGSTEVSTVDITIYSFQQVDLGNDTVICETDNIILDAGTGYTAYLWNTGDITQTLTVTAEGLYSVEAYTGHCYTYDTIQVSFATPAVCNAGSDESVCQNELFDFSLSETSPSASNYDSLLWIGGNGFFIDPQLLIPIYTPDSDEIGAIVLSLIAYPPGGCMSDTSTMILWVDSIPDADFVVLPATGACLGQEMLFTDNSSSDIISYTWDFGDGSPIESGDVTSHIYTTSGNYNVRLIVQNTNLCTDTITKTVIVFSSPIADFSYSPADSLCAESFISFFDSSPVPPVSWLWNFDDGGTASVQNPDHVFINSGAYNISLIITDLSGCFDTINQIINVSPLPDPSFTVSPNDSVCTDAMIAFTGLDNSGSTISNWSWDFGDGTVGVGSVTNHYFSQPGDYMVTLTLWSIGNCVGSNQQPVHIYPLPQSDFTIAPNDTSCMGELINFDATNITNDIVLWDWQFGDGNITTGQNVTHTYTQEGNLNISSIFQNSNGCVDTISHQRVVQNVTIDFDIAESPSCQDYDVVFTGTDGLVTFTDWNWDFGDGSPPGVGHNESHIYTQQDTVDVLLNVCSEQLVKQLVINATCEVDAGSNEATCEDVYFNLNLSTIPPSADAFDSIAWFTDGLGYFDDYRLMRPTYFPHPSEGAIQNDTLLLTMVGYGIAPCEDDTSTMELIVIPGAFAQAGSDENSCFGVPYDFANSTDSSFATNYVTIYWVTSGTGSFVNPNVEQPIYIPGPNEIGPVTLTMVAANIINCDSIDDMVLTIRPIYEIPVDITVCYYDSIYAQGVWQYSSGIFYDTLPTANYGCDSVIVTNFTVQSKIDNSFSLSTGDSICFGEIADFIPLGTANIITQFWDFGDGNTSLSANPSHEYINYGDYTVIYYYTDDNGCSDSAVRQVSVFELPVVNFTVSMTNACVNTEVDFIGISSSNIVTWDWDFGDGQSGVGQATSHVYDTWGNMTIILTVTDVHGCSESSMQTLTIAQPPIA
ncbi:MAG: PKD domain-containing protein, partial [Bacteroidota bacterium]